MRDLPFNRPFMTGKELSYIREAHHIGHLSANGSFTRRCHEWLRKQVGCAAAYLVHSGTSALEMATLLADIRPGDEVIMPSYTFPSTANAVVLRGGIPVFVDIRPDTLNLDETIVRHAVTQRTKAIIPVHYAGVASEMEAIAATAEEHGLFVIEDAAQGVGASYRGRPLGSFGHMAAVSFHETKNIISGEGGALLINDPTLTERADVVWEKGTNRKRFYQGEVDKYSWIDMGSSFGPSELIAAFLWAQMEAAEGIIKKRKEIWDEYHRLLADLDDAGYLKRPQAAAGASHNAHMYYILVSDKGTRDDLMGFLKGSGIGAIFHYVPLHSSRAGLRYGRVHGEMAWTDSISERIIRLPLWIGLTSEDTLSICERIKAFFLGDGGRR